MVGFDDGLFVRLMDILTGEPSNQRLVVPITGMGGLGKTSLAKTIYDHSYVEQHFDLRLWATISQQYSVEHILTQLLYGERISTTSGNVSELGEELRKKKLWGRRYLIVLDDMWSVDAWDEIRMSLPDNGNGSRVVVTTRLSDLAAHLSSSSPFEMDFLDQDNSWELFCGKTFGKEEDCPVELEEIGKKIVKRCGGLPLSIVVMGGHLRGSRAIEYWEKVARYMNPISSIGEEEQCLEILILSYQHLPACLKPCFLYLGIFGEDEWIDASKLLQLWIGEGLLRVKKGLSMEEVGENYLKDLINRNLILVEACSWNGKAIYCKVHDSVREACLNVCDKEDFLCVVRDDTRATSRRERRLVIQKFNSNMNGAKQFPAPPLPLVDCNLLRVLVHDNGVTDGLCLPLAHFQLVNLRSLYFVNYGLHSVELAYSILSLIPACWNLETLYMSTSSYETITLPYEIWEMPQLSIIHADAVFLLDPAPGERSEQRIVLQNLYTLQGVVNLRLTEEVCKRMPNLKTLWVRYNHFSDDYCLHNIGRFNKLKSLHVRSDHDSKWCDDAMILTLPTSLEELSLDICHLHWEDLTTMISSLPDLGKLYVTSCGSEWNLDDEEFSCLKSLHIWSCAELMYWNANSSHFPVLQSLHLSNLPILSEIPLDIGDIPTLRRINLSGCGASVAVSAVKMVMEQETMGNEDLQLHIEFWQINSEEFERFQEMLQKECVTTNSFHLYYAGKKIEL